VQVRPDLKVDDAVESAVVVLWVKRFAIIDHCKKTVILRHTFKGDFVSSIRKVLCYRQAPGDVSEPQVISDKDVQNV
jgi:hypothetical protein